MNKIPPLEELEAALEDVRQLRMTVDSLRRSHPIRLVLQPLARYMFYLAPMIVVYGVGIQWLIDSGVKRVWGLSIISFIMLVSLFYLCVASLMKYLTFDRMYRKQGMDTNKAIRRIFLNDGYIRIVLGLIPAQFVLIVVFVQAGLSHHIVGLIGLVSGAVYIIAPLAVPMDEITWIGVMLLVGSAISLFVFPAYPFYKVAILFGGACLGFGPIGFKKWEGVEEEDERSN